MNKTFKQGREEIAALCKYFNDNHVEFLAPGVKEAHVRQILIDPFFEALGWDIRNTDKVAPQYREVMIEDSLDVEGQQKAPDYCFRIGTLPKFYVEAKRCGINIHSDPSPAYQLRRYGWSAKVGLSILTDFEELSIYDCSIRPKPNDKAGYSRKQYLRFDEYPDLWREIWDLFSREAVWSGSYDKYVASQRKRGTSEVDVEFLKEIEGWRDSLARNIALRNKTLSSDDLNYAVQRTIDRIVFLRMAEDRGIEPYEQLLKLCERPQIYSRFMKELCIKADEKYNSGLFHFQKETGIAETPDQITPRLTVDDKAIKPILKNLYFAHGSPYHFGVLPVEILGTVYERFLGKVIRLTAKHHAKVEEKPEVRKAGGVYYTPDYIVDYIVEHTVGVQVEGKSPVQLSGARGAKTFRVLDPACGSGSFLLGAYSYLLRHCLNWYTEHTPSRYKKAVYKDSRTREWHLTIFEKKRILQTHIFGVDIDPQAVEVSKLSLLLKVLEDETNQSLGQQMQLFHERALPNLSDNIKCGNSLIAPDIYMGNLIVDQDLMKRINPFDWEQEYPEAMKAGGFDCVISNPPYVLISSELFDEQTISYLRRYEVAQYRADLFHIFIQKGISLTKNKGLFGMIIPITWLTLKHSDRLRSFIATNTSINELVLFDHLVFKDANVFTTLLFTERQKPSPHHKVAVRKVPEARSTNNISDVIPNYIEQSDWSTADDCIFETRLIGRAGTLVKQLIESIPPLESVARASLGCQAYNRSKHTKKQIDNRVFHSNYKKSKDYLPELAGKDVGRYEICRERGQWIKYGPWLHDYRTMDWLEGPRILIREISGHLPHAILGSYTEETYCHYKTILNVNPSENTTFSMKYLLGILNSRLISFLYPFISNKIVMQAFPRLSVNDIRRLPICTVNLSVPSERSIHDRMETLVESMIDLHKQLAESNSEQQKELIQRQIDSTDSEIDRLVYDLYGLNKEEINIVEGK